MNTRDREEYEYGKRHTIASLETYRLRDLCLVITDYNWTH